MIGKIRDMLTFEGLAYAVYDYPDMVEDMVETCCQLVEDSLDRLLPHFDFDYASGWEDICFKNGPIVSVDFFRDVVTPRYKRIRRKLDAYGIDLWYTDCDGDVRPILPYLIEGGINCLFPFEVMGCSHPGELLDRVSGHAPDHGRGRQNPARQRPRRHQGLSRNPRPVRRTRRLHPVLRPPLPAERQAGRLSVLSRSEAEDVRPEITAGGSAADPAPAAYRMARISSDDFMRQRGRWKKVFHLPPFSILFGRPARSR